MKGPQANHAGLLAHAPQGWRQVGSLHVLGKTPVLPAQGGKAGTLPRPPTAPSPLI